MDEPTASTRLAFGASYSVRFPNALVSPRRRPEGEHLDAPSPLLRGFAALVYVPMRSIK